jgi:hypothetical protein
MVDLSTQTLAQLMVNRRKCLTQLRDLGRRQAELIAAGEMNDLLKLIGAKQQLIVALQSLEKRLTAFHEQDAESRQWESDEARARCAADAESCRRLIDEVMAMEQEGEMQMTRRRDELAGQLRMVASGGRVREAYQANR